MTWKDLYEHICCHMWHICHIQAHIRSTKYLVDPIKIWPGLRCKLRFSSPPQKKTFLKRKLFLFKFFPSRKTASAPAGWKMPEVWTPLELTETHAFDSNSIIDWTHSLTTQSLYSELVSQAASAGPHRWWHSGRSSFIVSDPNAQNVNCVGIFEEKHLVSICFLYAESISAVCRVIRVTVWS